MAEKITTETIQAYGRTFVKGNVPEINTMRCSGCSNCVDMCKKLGPNVFEIKDGVARLARPENCIGDGACMLSCPTKALFLMSRYNPAAPPIAV